MSQQKIQPRPSAAAPQKQPQGSGMNIKAKAQEPNKVMFPIYSMEMYDNFVYMGGGGGGKEIKN